MAGEKLGGDAADAPLLRRHLLVPVRIAGVHGLQRIEGGTAQILFFKPGNNPPCRCGGVGDDIGNLTAQRCFGGVGVFLRHPQEFPQSAVNGLAKAVFVLHDGLGGPRKAGIFLVRVHQVVPLRTDLRQGGGELALFAHQTEPLVLRRFQGAAILRPFCFYSRQLLLLFLRFRFASRQRFLRVPERNLHVSLFRFPRLDFIGNTRQIFFLVKHLLSQLFFLCQFFPGKPHRFRISLFRCCQRLRQIFFFHFLLRQRFPARQKLRLSFRQLGFGVFYFLCQLRFRFLLVLLVFQERFQFLFHKAKGLLFHAEIAAKTFHLLLRFCQPGADGAHFLLVRQLILLQLFFRQARCCQFRRPQRRLVFHGKKFIFIAGNHAAHGSELQKAHGAIDGFLLFHQHFVRLRLLRLFFQGHQLFV